MESHDLRFFLSLAKASTLSEASRVLGVSPPAVSQRLALIEERIGMRLIERGRGLSVLTSEGELLARRAAILVQELDELNEELATQRSALSGPLNVIAPLGFGRAHVAPILGELTKLHPGIIPELRLSDDPVGSASKETWDIIIHIGTLKDSTLVQRKLAPNRRLLCAAPEYLRLNGAPKHPKDLKDHACGAIREDQQDATMWNLKGTNHIKHSVHILPKFASNDGDVVKSWAAQGLGIVARSEWDVFDELKSGNLIRVLEDYNLPDADIVALLNPKTLRSKRVAKAIEAFSDTLKNPAWQIT